MDKKAFFSITPALSRSFWAFNITGWLMLIIVHILFRAVVPSSSVWTVWSLYLLLENSIGFTLMICLRTLYRRVKYQEINYVFLIIFLVLVSLSAGIVWQSAYIIIAYALGGQSYLIYYLQLRWIILNSITYQFPIAVGWSILYFGIKFWFDWHDQRETAEKAIMAAHQAQLQTLRYKLKPNFLFNALLTIRAILEEDKKNAKKLITDLSEFLRYSLLSMHNSVVPLRDEIEATKQYLNIEKFRYENRLVVEYDIDSRTYDLPVLSFLIHPIVEQAIDRCVKANSLPLRIGIKTRIAEKNLSILISTACKLPDTETRLKKNDEEREMEHLIERLKNIFGDDYCLDIHENNETMMVEIILKDIVDREFTGTLTASGFSPITDRVRS